MSQQNFKRGTAYIATNYRTRETFPVVCVSNKVSMVTFETMDGNRFNATPYSSTASYVITARNDKLHVLVRTEER